MDFKKWSAADPATEEEVKLLIELAEEDLADSNPGESSFYVIGKTLICAGVSEHGSLDYYITEIKESNRDYEDMEIEAEAKFNSQGLPS